MKMYQAEKEKKNKIQGRRVKSESKGKEKQK